MRLGADPAGPSSEKVVIPYGWSLEQFKEEILNRIYTNPDVTYEDIKHILDQLKEYPE
jgi:hypothetical protein